MPVFSQVKFSPGISHFDPDLFVLPAFCVLCTPWPSPWALLSPLPTTNMSGSLSRRQALVPFLMCPHLIISRNHWLIFQDCRQLALLCKALLKLRLLLFERGPLKPCHWLAVSCSSNCPTYASLSFFTCEGGLIIVSTSHHRHKTERSIGC